MIFNSIQKKLDKYQREHPKYPTMRCQILGGNYNCSCVTNQRIYDNHRIGVQQEREFFTRFCENGSSKISKINQKIQNDTNNYIKTGCFSCKYLSEDDSSSERSVPSKLSQYPKSNIKYLYSTASTQKVRITQLSPPKYEPNRQIQRQIVSQRAQQYNSIKPILPLRCDRGIQTPQTEQITFSHNKQQYFMPPKEPTMRKEPTTHSIGTDNFLNQSSDSDGKNQISIQKYEKQPPKSKQKPGIMTSQTKIKPKQNQSQNFNQNLNQKKKQMKKISKLSFNGNIPGYFLIALSVILIIIQLIK